MNRIRYFIGLVTIVAVLALSGVNATPALADDALPPPVEVVTEVEEESTPPAEESTPPAEESAPLAEESAPAESLQETLEILPEDTSVIVLDENGEALPLASSAAEEVIAESDPQWCPTGTTPGAPTCSGVKTSFNDPVSGLVAWLSANPQTVAGTIWIQNTYVGTSVLEGSSVILEGTSFGSTANYNLTINGGWTGTGTGISGTSTFNVPLLIQNWNAGVTINNIVVFNATLTNASADNVALGVGAVGDVVLKNVTVEKASNPDATYKMHGAQIQDANNLTVIDSSFNKNEGDGLSAIVRGKVTVTNLAALNNGGYGFYLENNYVAATVAQPVTLSGVLQFNGNGGDGLNIHSNGAVTIANLSANNNSGRGTLISNTDSTSLPTPAYQAVSLTGVNELSGNANVGLQINASGAIAVSNITANGNKFAGILLNNTISSVRSPVNMTGYAIANSTISGDGINIHSDGAVTLANLTASFNGGYGLSVYNINAPSLPVDVKITGVNVFNNNSSSGALIFSYGAITLASATSSNNGSMGIWLDNSGSLDALKKPVSVTGYVRVENNASNGLIIYSKGAVSVASASIYKNGNGVSILSRYDPAIPLSVTFTGVNSFSNNSGIGLNISTYGAVSLSNVTAEYNGAYGVYINNAGTTPLRKPVTFIGYARLNNNSNMGAFVNSGGLVSMANVSAFNNGANGVEIVNNDSSALPADVILTGVNAFEHNIGKGLNITTFGAVTINNLTASYNSGSAGVDISNPVTSKPVTLSGYVRAFANNGDGLHIYVYGAVTASNVQAVNNAGYGASISSVDSAGKDVKILGVNSFSKNGQYGLLINAYGAVFLSSITADKNTSSGIYVANSFAFTPKPVTISGYASAYGNGSTGINILSRGLVTLANVSSLFNSVVGAYIGNNYDTAAPMNVVLSGSNNFSNNGNTGLSINSYGSILVNNLTANNNLNGGAVLANNSAATPKPITITGYARANNNALSGGLSLAASGAVSVANATASNNAVRGLYITNNTDPAKQFNVTVSGVNNFDGNDSLGLQIFSYGAVTLNAIHASNNGGSGLAVHNDGGALAKNVTLTGYNLFNGNFSNGLDIMSDGQLIAARISASGNGQYGVYVGTTGTITVSVCLVATANGNSGVYLNGNGAAVTVKGLLSAGNDVSDTIFAPSFITRKFCL